MIELRITLEDAVEEKDRTKLEPRCARKMWRGAQIWTRKDSPKEFPHLVFIQWNPVNMFDSHKPSYPQAVIDADMDNV